MLTFADTGWHVVTAFVAFMLGIILAIAQRPVFGVSRPLAISLYLWHTALCLYYIYYSMNNLADSIKYYEYSFFYSEGFSLGTRGIYLLTSIFTKTLGMSYGGTFLVYNIFGFIGLIALTSALSQILPERKLATRKIAIAALFLPGISFWSSAIGKDSLAFMASGLAIWASLRLGRRYPALLLALVVFFLVRPHIGGIMVIALALALTFALRAGVAAKAALLAAAIPAAAGAMFFALDYAGISDPAGISDVTDYIEERQGHNMGGGSSIDIASMAWPVRIVSYLFRPLPLESPGILGLVVGFENIILLAILGFFLLKSLGSKSRMALFPRAFMLLFAFGSLIILANTTANLGIAIRQKWMFVPMLLCVAFSYAGAYRPSRHPTKAAIA